MIVFFDDYVGLDNMLLETMQCIVSDCKALVFRDEPFLPHGMLSIYEYYVNKYEGKSLKEKDVFYVFLDIPELWEVRAEGVNGAIFDKGKKKATIYFRRPLENRNVQRIEWNTENGTVYKIDYYNRYGVVYCTAFVNSDGVMESRAYYTSENKEIIHVNCSNGVITLFEDGHVIYMFSSMEEFELFTLKEVMEKEGFAVLTSSRQAQWMTKFECTDNFDILIALQSESAVKECQAQQFHQLLHCPLLVLNNFDTNACLVDNTKNEFRICYSAAQYPEVKGKAEALILTASDSLFGIEQLIEYLPEVNFHIAANTEVSQKLKDMSVKDNVYIYPQISQSELQHLYKISDFYLDINNGREIFNAVISATINNMLIFGYCHTLHNKYYVLEECIFEKGEEERFAQKIYNLIDNERELEKLITKQQEKIKESIKHMME